MTTNDDILEHYGVKGMRWGQRKARMVSPSSRDSSRTVYKKPPHKLTDAELKRRIARMEMEKKYNDLNSKDLSEGRAVANNILRNSGGVAASAIITGAIGLGFFGLKKIIEKKTAIPIKK